MNWQRATAVTTIGLTSFIGGSTALSLEMADNSDAFERASRATACFTGEAAEITKDMVGCFTQEEGSGRPLPGDTFRPGQSTVDILRYSVEQRSQGESTNLLFIVLASLGGAAVGSAIVVGVNRAWPD